jgi:hypothetical protein
MKWRWNKEVQGQGRRHGEQTQEEQPGQHKHSQTGCSWVATTGAGIWEFITVAAGVAVAGAASGEVEQPLVLEDHKHVSVMLGMATP